MRLTCPSCASEYDVDAAAIGDRGRMVRCANCGAEWFQAPDASAAAAAPPPPPVVEPDPQPAPPPEPAYSAPDPVYSAPEPEIPAPTHEPAPIVQDAPPEPEFRPEPVVQSFTPPNQDNVERIYYDMEPAAAPKFEETSVVDETRVRRRREDERDDLADSLRELEEDSPNRSGGAFLAGFSTVAVLAVVLIAVYVKAPDLAKVAPGIEGPLSGYTDMVDKGRFALAAATQ